MRQRGIDNGAELLDTFATAEAVLGAIRWFDERKTRRGRPIGPGLLAKVIREGGMPNYPHVGAGRAPVPRPAPATLDPRLERDWARVQVELRALVGDTTYAVWLAGLTPRSLHDGVLELDAPAATAAWIAKRFRVQIERAAQSMLPASTVVIGGEGGVR